MITTRLTAYIKDVVEDIDIATANMEEDPVAPKVAIEVAISIIQTESSHKGYREG
jgi:hypothetical protein